MSDSFRPVYEQPIYKIIIPVRDLSLDKAIPQFAAAIDAQIDCDDASDDFIKEKLHTDIRSTPPSDNPLRPPTAASAGDRKTQQRLLAAAPAQPAAADPGAD